MTFGRRNNVRRGPAVAVADRAVIADLEWRVDEALATARASEAAIMTVGAAAFDAAEQALRAAELAARGSAFVARLAGNPSQGAHETSLPRPIDAALLPPEPAAGEITVSASMPVELEDGRLRAFNLRADRLASRLCALA